MNIEKLIEKNQCKKFYILDTTQDGLSDKILYNNGDITYHRYCYNIHKYSKLEESGIFIYRQTKRSSKNRKFYFFGGGIIDSIKEISSDGSVEAIIRDGFKFETPLYEDDPKLELIEWTSKNKISGSWSYFWNQYGMNEITKEEFIAIMKDIDIIDAKSFYKENFIADFIEESKPLGKIEKEPRNFIGKYTKHGTVINKKNRTKKFSSARKIDFNSLNQKKKTLGTFGEMLILTDEVNQIFNYDINRDVEHVSITQGDGLGYDILSYNELGEEVYIEVKTTTSNKIDGFYLSPKELECAKNLNNYKVYRVYNLDMTNETYDVEIFDGKEVVNMFELVPVSYRAVFKG